MAKLTQVVALHWAMEMLKGNSLPDYAPAPADVVEALQKIQNTLNAKAGRSGRQ